jgi:hypothetical protein
MNTMSNQSHLTVREKPILFMGCAKRTKEISQKA